MSVGSPNFNAGGAPDAIVAPRAGTVRLVAVRIEHDSMGPVEVPDDARWGAQTQRAIDNFAISGLRLPHCLIVAMATIKGAAAQANAQLGVIDQDMATAITHAAQEITEGGWTSQFPVDVFQTGSGTSSNMNINEVIANLASERLGRPVHPNDHVNASQSSNDVFPSALHLAAASSVTNDLNPAIGYLVDALRFQEQAMAPVVKAGRTHLMDATPVTVGQEFGGWACAVARSIERLSECLARLVELALGGTAVGTGINVPPGFAADTIDRLAADTGLALVEAPDHFEAQAGREAVVELSGHLRTLAVSLARITTDLRWMASGPATGLGEVRLPDLAPGSSIMPGKVNPVVPEAVWQIAAQVIGNDATVTFAATAGSFELSMAMPVIAHNVLGSLALLTSGCTVLADCIRGVEANVDQCRRYAESSPALATALNPRIGYEAAVVVVNQALAEGRTVKEVVLERGLMTAAEADQVLDVMGMTRGGIRTGSGPTSPGS